MFRIYLAAVDTVPAAMVLVPVFALLYCTKYKRDGRKCILYCLFCLYLSAVFVLVGIPNVTYLQPGMKLNLIPFQGFLADLKNSLLNIALFVPLGFFLPVLWGRFRKPSLAVWFGFGLSLTIELMQMLTYRMTDVNDLITNALGTALGFLAAKPVVKWCLPISRDSVDAYSLTVLSFAIMFFLHPVLSPWLWDGMF